MAPGLECGVHMYLSQPQGAVTDAFLLVSSGRL